jgi:hypothetical protein
MINKVVEVSYTDDGQQRIDYFTILCEYIKNGNTWYIGVSTTFYIFIHFMPNQIKRISR